MNLLTKILRFISPSATPYKTNCWKVAGCSLPGTAHLRRGRFCEDSFGSLVNDDLLGIAVADGAGSAAQAALGSKLAVRTALLALREQHLKAGPITADNAKEALIVACRQTLNTLCDRAAEIGAEPRDLACTLIIVIASRNFVFAAQVGDGAVVLKDDDGNLHCLTTPTNGEFANETILMGCSQTLDVQIRSFPRYQLKSIAVFSDGLQRLSLRMPECEPHAQFFHPLFDRLQHLTEPDMEKFLQEFLDSPGVNNRTDDDKTLVTARFI
jgi:serine/threonine protein phosphatase PrpC